MTSPKPSVARDKTDDSLREERDKTDLAIAEGRDLVQESADEVLRRAREERTTAQRLLTPNPR